MGEAQWEDKKLADAGLLIRMFNASMYDQRKAYMPPVSKAVSGSFVFADQRRASNGMGMQSALFSQGCGTGIIFRPHVTILKCARSFDADGQCGKKCSGSR